MPDVVLLRDGERDSSGRQRRAIRELQRHIAAPTRLEWRCIQNDPAIVNKDTCFQRKVSGFWNCQTIHVMISWQLAYTGNPMVLDWLSPFEAADNFRKSPKDSPIALE